MIIDRPIAEVFLEAGLVSQDELVEILAKREDTTEPLGDLLVRLNKITLKQKLRCEAVQMGVPFIDLTQIEIDPNASRCIPHAAAMRLLAIPIELSDVAATVAMARPLDLSAIDELVAMTGREIDPLLAAEEDVREAIFRSFGAYDDLSELVGDAILGTNDEDIRIAAQEEEDHPAHIIDIKEVVEGAPIVKLANALLTKAISMRASDIHIEPNSRRVRIRLRIDGLLQEIMVVPKDLQHPLVSRLKILGGMDIAERRVPQDGRCTLVSSQGEYDFRVSTYPSIHGETVGIRILDKHSSMIDIQRLGMSEEALHRFTPLLNVPQGLILVTGPTGSGKTTTLYAGIHYLNTVNRKIITIEDPVEYQLDGVTQANVNNRAGVTFATGLRAILRQDPDVLLVGEVRDVETAGIAIEAALTGHLVLTSLHANDAASALSRLMDMGVETFLLASSITTSIGQRLVRMNCTKCIETYSPDEVLRGKLDLPSDHEYIRGRGCEYCAKTGFRGRVGLYEILEVTPEIRRRILAGEHHSEIRTYAEAEGMSSIRMDGRSKVLSGVTTAEEVLRATSET
ncbi:MAG: GspE/PulE family protein [Fimbriimonadales bacterium]